MLSIYEYWIFVRSFLNWLGAGSPILLFGFWLHGHYIVIIEIAYTFIHHGFTYISQDL
jgi:hypothetical protein